MAKEYPAPYEPKKSAAQEAAEKAAKAAKAEASKEKPPVYRLDQGESLP